MIPEEFERRMRECFSKDAGGHLDREVAHVDADDLMCELLKSLGYGAGVKVYEEEEKWHS